MMSRPVSPLEGLPVLPVDNTSCRVRVRTVSTLDYDSRSQAGAEDGGGRGEPCRTLFARGVEVWKAPPVRQQAKIRGGGTGRLGNRTEERGRRTILHDLASRFLSDESRVCSDFR